ncbi:MAG: hypothetical protein ACFFGZ_15230 [Candidatus Thorarchaeota archaeon]
MIVYSVYITTDDGRTVLTEHFQSTKALPDELLMGAFFSSLQIMAAEMTHKRSLIKSIQIEGFAYHIRSFGFFSIIIATDSSEPPEDLIQTLGLRFMNDFGETLVGRWSLLSTFVPFKKILHEVIRNETTTLDDSQSIEPAKKLDSAEIFSLPHHLQATALALVSLQEGTIEEIAQESEADPIVTEENLISLKEMGLIGRKTHNGETTFFCTVTG